MNYRQTIEYLYARTPLFQNVGSGAYKEGLENTLLLDRQNSHPHRNYRVIHVAGTNGKGSVSHTLAAMLQAAGYTVGLYTSPHLMDFRERIRVNGKPISEESVVEYIERERSFFEPLHPSFFEVTTAMAFSHFAKEKVDVAVVEVGLGGRLDCTNIVNPVLSIITNIGLDHTQFLGDTLAEIAREKAGIIKERVPVVIGEQSEETRSVFLEKAAEMHAPIHFAEEEIRTIPTEINYNLKGNCQTKNRATILTAVNELRKAGFRLPDECVKEGFEHVCSMTGLMGRWQCVNTTPKVYCDTGHNLHGMRHIVSQLNTLSSQRGFGELHIVFGMVNDKDIEGVLAILPLHARYYFTQASVKRAMPCGELAALAARHNLKGSCHPTLQEAYSAALKAAGERDFIFVGGSTFVVADLLNYLYNSKA